jgi:ribosomal protein S19E (S16A)
MEVETVQLSELEWQALEAMAETDQSSSLDGLALDTLEGHGLLAKTARGWLLTPYGRRTIATSRRGVFE